METFSTFIAGKIVVTEAASGRVKNKPLAPIPALTKANIKHSHNQSAFKKNKTMVGVSDKDYDKAKKLLSNMPNVMLHTEENIKENPALAVGGAIVRTVAKKAVGSVAKAAGGAIARTAVSKAASYSSNKSNNESVNEMHCKDCGCEKGNIDPNCDCTNDGSAPATAEHWVSGTNEARQLKNKDTEMMVTLPNKKGGVKTIDAKDWPQFKKRGYVQAENVQQPWLDEASLHRMNLIKKIAKHGSPKVKAALKAPSRVDNNKDKKKEDVNERNYRKEYDNYQGKPEQIANRSSRNSARRIMGDDAIKGMDVGHKDNNPLNNDPSNLQMEEPSENRREPRLRDEAKAIVKKDRQGSGKPMSGYDKVAKKYGVKPIKKKEEVEEKYTGGNRRDWAKGYDFDQDTDVVKGFVSPKAKNLAKSLVKSKTPMAKAMKQIKSKYPSMSADSITSLLKTSGIKEGAKPGLWDNIRKRRAAGKPKLKPGDKNYPKTLDIDEGKMKDLAIKIDNVVSNMRKDKIMKPFADKFKKDAMKSLDIRKSLEKILPDYVAGKSLDKVMV